MLSTKQQLTEVSTRLQAVGPLNVKISTNVIKPLKCQHFTTIVKIIIDSHDFKYKYENGLRAAGLRLRKSN